MEPAAAAAPEAGHVVDALKDIQTRLKAATPAGTTVRLVAVSKTKPASLVRACYDAGHRSFGENYVQELQEKAPQLPSDIQWHFIGGLQSNKCKKLLEIPNLAMVESVDSEKLARALDKAAAGRASPLAVMLQVNTSNEESKGGVNTGAEVAALATLVQKELKHLRLAGLMTIGDPDAPPERDFQRLVECRQAVATALSCPPTSLELSMGMSHDFELAARMGSTNVRVGSSIFGARAPKK